MPNILSPVEAAGEYSLLEGEFGEQVLEALRKRFNLQEVSEGLQQEGGRVMGSSPLIVGAINTILDERQIEGWEDARVPHAGRVIAAYRFGDLLDRFHLAEVYHDGALILSDDYVEGPRGEIKEDLTRQLLEARIISDLREPVIVLGYGLEETKEDPRFIDSGKYRFKVLNSTEAVEAKELTKIGFVDTRDLAFLLEGVPKEIVRSKRDMNDFRLDRFEGGLASVTLRNYLSANDQDLTGSGEDGIIVVERNPEELQKYDLESRLALGGDNLSRTLPVPPYSLTTKR